MIKKLQKLLLTLLLFSLGTNFIFHAELVAMQKPQPATIPVKTDQTSIQDPSLDEYIISDKELEELADFKDDEKSIKEIEEDVQKSFQGDPKDWDEWMEEKNNILLFHPIDILQTPGGPIKVGFYVEDIFNFIFLGSDLFIDHYLHKNLKDYYVDFVFEKIDQNLDPLIDFLSKLNFSTNKNELKNNAEKDLYDYIAKEHSIPVIKIIRSPFFKKLIFYFLLSETSRTLKRTFLGERDTISMKSIFKNIGRSGFLRFLSGKPVHAFDFVKFTAFISNLSVTPLYSSTSYISQLFIEYYKFKNQNKMQDAKNNETGFWGFYFKFLDSHFTSFFKEIIILGFSLKLLDQYAYKNSWVNTIKNNHEDFLKLLKEYKATKKAFRTSDEESKNKYFEAEKKLKHFIFRGHDINFMSWLRNKNAAFQLTKDCTELILNIPTYYLMVKSSYNFFKNYATVLNPL